MSMQPHETLFVCFFASLLLGLAAMFTSGWPDK